MRGVPKREAAERRARFLSEIAKLALPDAQASALLGVHRSTWSLYRSGMQPVPRYILAGLVAYCALKEHAPKVFAKLLNDSETRRQQ